MRKTLYMISIFFLICNVVFFALPIKAEAKLIGIDNKEYNRRTAKQIVKTYYDGFMDGTATGINLEKLMDALGEADYEIKQTSSGKLILNRSSKATTFPTYEGGHKVVSIDDPSEFYFESEYVIKINDMLSNYSGDVKVNESGIVTDALTTNEDPNNLPEYDGPTVCEMVAEIYSVMKYVVALLMVIFAALDLTKAVAAGDDEKMKKAQKNAFVRLGAGAAIFILPVIIRLIMAITGLPLGECFSKF